MYIPKHFKMENLSTIYEFIEHNSFGVLFSMQDHVPVASHLPFLLDREGGYLYSHMARPNNQWKDITGQEVLVVFPGPHSYVSSSWYETNQSVPTWNYIAAHIYGRIEIMDEQDDVVRSLEKLVLKYEGAGSTYRVDESNKALIEGLTRGIVAFRLKIDRMEGKWKLSQNQSEDRQRAVIQQLEQSANDDAKKIAELMRKNL
ncbi:FMN-binding negative transcriptional regulator [Paenibacillus nanensis]|uniref:FMN-binding negative transcriptional regulator n=1 Tax=Paenibacillus nanensis TaxID=393251 RepID=A0A3A1UYX3_9BACL|nr:FMN-binding negative transcriptional regulator [Paenibacillus nanensis]RIX53688.1 FMN-binding negative transcriptional regulator [Paenibacillus nanensis]